MRVVKMVDSAGLLYKTVRWQILQQDAHCDWAPGSEYVNIMSDIVKCLSTSEKLMRLAKKLQS